MPYPLAALLEVREKETQDAAAKLAAAQDEHARAAERLEEAERALEARRAEHAAAVERHEQGIATGTRTAAEIVGGDRFLAALVARTAEARSAADARRAELAKAAAVVEHAREVLAAAVKAEKSLHKHRESWQAEEKATADRKAEDELDDLAARRR